MLSRLRTLRQAPGSVVEKYPVAHFVVARLLSWLQTHVRMLDGAGRLEIGS